LVCTCYSRMYWLFL